VNKWIPDNKWVAAQGVMASGLIQSWFETGWDKQTEGKFAALWIVAAVVSYFTTNKRLPDANS
jgi:hypothetical protein